MSNLWIVVALLAAAGLSAYLVRQFAWHRIKNMKILAFAAGLAGFLVLFVLSLLPAAYMAGISFGLLSHMGWPLQVGFYVAALTTAVITAPLTLLVVLCVAWSEKLFAGLTPRFGG